MSHSFLAKNFRNLGLLVLGGLIGSTAYAQASVNYPNKPITLVVTYPPGGGADAMARLLAPKMSEALGHNVVVDNKPGAGGQIGAAAVAKAAPDGYTLMLDASSFAVNPSLYRKLPYDPIKAFTPIGVVALFPNVVLVTANFSAQNVSDLIAVARKAKGSVSYASSGNGSAQHLAGALFESATGVDMIHVPYKGGGHRQSAQSSALHMLQCGSQVAEEQRHLPADNIVQRGTAATRSPMLPGVPTLSEAGVKGAEIYEWNAVFVPAGTPQAVIGKIASAFQHALDAPEVKQRIAQLGGEIQRSTPEQARAFIEQQVSQWGRVIRERNISVE